MKDKTSNGKMSCNEDKYPVSGHRSGNGYGRGSDADRLYRMDGSRNQAIRTYKR